MKKIEREGKEKERKEAEKIFAELVKIAESKGFNIIESKKDYSYVSRKEKIIALEDMKDLRSKCIVLAHELGHIREDRDYNICVRESQKDALKEERKASISALKLLSSLRYKHLAQAVFYYRQCFRTYVMFLHGDYVRQQIAIRNISILEENLDFCPDNLTFLKA